MFRYLLPLLLLFMAGCSTKVDTDYDPGYKTEALRTFALLAQNSKGLETLDDERIIGAVTREMEGKGYQNGPKESADFHIAFQTRLVEDVPSNVSFGFGFGTYSGGLGTSVGTTHNVVNDEEQIEINMIDPTTKKSFWHASVTKKRRNFKTPQERSDYIDKTVASMLATFPVQGAKTK